MLTIEDLDALPPEEIFQTGSVLDSAEPGEGNVALCFPISNKIVRWVAVRGKIPDWCIYVDNPHYQGTPFEFVSNHDIKNHGDKITHNSTIKKLVPCTDDAFSMYRK